MSWQRLLHVKPSDVSFEPEALAWSPDGRALALGCAEGEVVVVDIETGVPRPELRALRALHAPRHDCAVTSMHWVQRTHLGGSVGRSVFRDRATRLLDAPTSNQVLGISGDTVDTTAPSVLATADESGHVVLWWSGTTCVAEIDIGTLFRQSTMGGAETTTTTSARIVPDKIAVERVHVAPDLSRLFAVLTVRPSATTTPSSPLPATATESTRGCRRELVALDLGAIRRFQDDLSVVARTVDACQCTLNQVVLAMRQMSTEWKASTRVFELKLGLLSSLYEKYACDDPPQVHMLATLASGITSPALAQYFAQDIQETVRVDRTCRPADISGANDRLTGVVVVHRAWIGCGSCW